MPFDLSLPALLWAAAAFGLAGFVKGYAGFGFSAVALTGTGLVTDPRNLLAAILLMDLVLTLQQVPSIRAHVQWRRVGLLAVGAALGVPVGVAVIARTGPDEARALIGALVLLMSGVLAAGWHLARAPGNATWAGVGVASGLANGAAVGGLPVAAFLAAQPIPAAAFRATNVAYFTLLDIWTLPIMGWNGLVSPSSFGLALLMLPTAALGIWAGERRFAASGAASFRRFAIGLLATLSILAILRALL